MNKGRNPDAPMSEAEINDEIALRAVITLREAADMWRKEPKTILAQVWQGRIIGRKSGATWLILLSSVVAHYGVPVKGMGYYEE